MEIQTLKDTVTAIRKLPGMYAAGKGATGFLSGSPFHLAGWNSGYDYEYRPYHTNHEGGRICSRWKETGL